MAWSEKSVLLFAAAVLLDDLAAALQLLLLLPLFRYLLTERIPQLNMPFWHRLEQLEEH